MSGGSAVTFRRRSDRSAREAIDRTIEDGKTATVHLTEPLRVFILYWTAEPDMEGGIRFYEDVYNRAPAVLAALDVPFRPDNPVLVVSE